MLRTFPGPSHSEFRCLSGILTHADEELVQQSQRIPKKVDNRLQLDAAVAFYLIHKLIMREHLSPSPCVLSKSEVESCMQVEVIQRLLRNDVCTQRNSENIQCAQCIIYIYICIRIYTCLFVKICHQLCSSMPARQRPRLVGHPQDAMQETTSHRRPAHCVSGWLWSNRMKMTFPDH